MIILLTAIKIPAHAIRIPAEGIKVPAEGIRIPAESSLYQQSHQGPNVIIASDEPKKECDILYITDITDIATVRESGEHFPLLLIHF